MSAWRSPRAASRGGWLAPAVLLTALVSWPLMGQAQITFPGASPVSAGNLFVHVMPEYFDYTQGVSSFVDKNVLIYGASPDLAFSLQNNSIVVNSAAPPRGVAAGRLNAVGFGDSVLEGRYTIFRQDGLGSTFRVAPYIGVGIPTGSDTVNPAMPRSLQPGTGVWSSRDALTSTYQTLYWNAAAEMGYQVNSSAAGYRPGNTYYADAAFRYLVWPRPLQSSVSSEFVTFVEANYSSAGYSQLSGQVAPYTGGQQLLIDPGISYTTRLFSLTLMGLLPAYQNFSSQVSRLNFGALLMFRLSMYTPHHW